MKRHSALIGFLTLAILMQVLFPMPALGSGMVEIVEQLSEADPTATPEVKPTPAPRRTPAPADPNVQRMKEQPESASGNIRLYTKSTLESDLRLNAQTLSFPANGLPVPLLYQFNYTTPFCTCGGRQRSVRSSGCGAVVASMIDLYINGNLNQTPYTVLYHAAEVGNYIGQGFTFPVLQEIIESYGIKTTYLEKNEDAMREALENGNLVVLCMGPGTFTYNGHYILVRGLDENGDGLVNDPNSEEHSRSHYTLRKLCREAKTGYMLIVSGKLKKHKKTA